MGVEEAGEKNSFHCDEILGSFSVPCSDSDFFFIILCFKPQFRFNTVPNEIIYLRLTAYFYLIYLTDFYKLCQP